MSIVLDLISSESEAMLVCCAPSYISFSYISSETTNILFFTAVSAIEASRLLCYNAAFRKDQNLSFVKESAMAKLFASQTAMDVTTEAIQIHGGYGYVKEYHVERMLRDAKITQIYEGTSEIQRLVIAREILKSIQ